MLPFEVHVIGKPHNPEGDALSRPRPDPYGGFLGGSDMGEAGSTMQLTRTAKPPIGDSRFTGVAGPGQLRHGAQLVTGVLRGAKAEPESAPIMNLGVVMQPAGAVSYIDEGDRR